MSGPAAGAPVHNIHPDLVALAVPIDSVRGLEGNPRIGNVPAVARSLEKFQQRKPITVRASTGEITAGNHTWQAAKSLGWTEIAAVTVDDDEATAKAWALADNRTAELGGYDNDALVAMLADVEALDPSLLEVTGWKPEQIADLLPDPGDAPTAPIPQVWGVVVSCACEEEQVDLLERLAGEGYDVKALLS